MGAVIFPIFYSHFLFCPYTMMIFIEKSAHFTNAMMFYVAESVCVCACVRACGSQH